MDELPIALGNVKPGSCLAVVAADAACWIVIGAMLYLLGHVAVWFLKLIGAW